MEGGIMASYNTYDDTYNQGVATGNQAIQGFDPTSSANSVRGGYNNLFGSQVGAGGPTNSTDYAKLYADTIAKNPTATQLYSTANDIFNVPNLQNNAIRLNNAVTNEVPNAYNLARGFDYGDAQVQNKINTDLRFMSPQANAAQANANTAAGLASQWVNQGMTQNQINLLPVQQQGQMLGEALARQSTGFDIAAQNELQGLVAKLNAGVTLSQAEIQRANELMKASQAYETALGVANINKQSAMGVAQIGNQYQTVPAGQTLVNTFNGGTYRAR